MLLTITRERAPATDLGWLLHKHPDRVQRFDLTFGETVVFYPEASEERCTAALMLRVDPVGLVRRKGGGGGFALEQYVNDRPYAASSLLSVAISRVYGTALAGRCAKRPELVDETQPLRARLAALPSRGGPSMIARLFEPLGYRVEARRHALDEKFPEWGESPYHTVELAAETTVKDLLSHLYVLVPVLDDDKHYWVGDSEVEKLLRHGERWLTRHPEQKLIARRYLKHRRGLVDAALARLLEDDGAADPDADQAAKDRREEAVERPLRLHHVRLEAVAGALRESGARRVLDLGCGEGKLLKLLLAQKQFREIAGVDVSHRALEIAAKRLRLDRLPERQRERLRLLHGSLTYRDARLAGYDAAALVEVIEHLDPGRLAALERVVFEQARPGTVVVTTPNREYNALFETLEAGSVRHPDHRFEWTREEFQRWAGEVAERHGYAARFAPIGPEDPELGAPTQMGIFKR